jgi:hypothetical protein
VDTIILKKRTKPDGKVNIEYQTDYLDMDIEVVLKITESPKQSKLDFSDLIGQLDWKEDAVAEQKKLRAEWD